MKVTKDKKPGVTMYVDREGNCSVRRPAPRPIVGAKSFSINGRVIPGTPPLEVIVWMAETLFVEARLPFVMLTVKE